MFKFENCEYDFEFCYMKCSNTWNKMVFKIKNCICKIKFYVFCFGTKMYRQVDINVLWCS